MYFFMPEGPESDSHEGPVGRSAPSVRSPHHLAAEGIEENMIEPFHYFYTVVCPANGQLSRLLARFAAAVDGNEEVMAAAFHVQCDFPIVSDNDRTDVEAMRSYRSDGNSVGMRDDDRASYTQRVGCGTCWSGNY